MEAAPRSPTQLLAPLWADEQDGLAALPDVLMAQLAPTSAELRQQLHEALSGDGAGGTDHLLHASPAAAGRGAPHRLVQPALHANPMLLRVKQGSSLIRTCSAPGGLLVGPAHEPGAPELQQRQGRGVAA